MVVVLKPAVKKALASSKFLAEGKRRVLLVGICGPSGSGKTTLAQELVKKLGTPLGSISADHFYDHSKAEVRRWRDKRTKKAKYERNLEVPEVIDSELLLSELYRIGNSLADDACTPEKVVLQTPLDSGINLTKKGWQRPGTDLGLDPVVLIVEGFLLYHNAQVAKACTHRLWLDLDRDIAMLRRYKRENHEEAIDEHYERWYRDSVWGNYETYRAIQMDHADQQEPRICRLDANQSSEQVLDQAMLYLNEHLKAGGIRHRCQGVVLQSRQGVILRSRKHVRNDDSRERHDRCDENGRVKSHDENGIVKSHDENGRVKRRPADDEWGQREHANRKHRW